jgi:hypothetical protein
VSRLSAHAIALSAGQQLARVIEDGLQVMVRYSGLTSISATGVLVEGGHASVLEWQAVDTAAPELHLKLDRVAVVLSGAVIVRPASATPEPGEVEDVVVRDRFGATWTRVDDEPVFWLSGTGTKLLWSELCGYSGPVKVYRPS